MEQTQIAGTQHDAFMRAVEKEMAKFERQDREERAGELRVRTEDYRLSH